MHNYASHYYRLDYKQTDKMHSNASHCYRLDYRRRTRCITMHHTVTDSTSTTSHIHTLQKRSFAWWTNHIIFKPLTHCHSSTMIRPKKYKYNTTKKRPPKGYSDDRMSAWIFLALKLLRMESFAGFVWTKQPPMMQPTIPSQMTEWQWSFQWWWFHHIQGHGYEKKEC